MSLQRILSVRSVAIAFAIALSAPFAVVAADAPQQDEPPFLGGFLRDTTVLYPERIGEWGSIGEHRYEDAQSGVSVRYVRKDDDVGRIDVFFYPIGAIEDADFAKLADQERQQLLAAWGSAMRDPAAMTPLMPTTFPKPDATKEDGKPEPVITARTVDFAFDYEGKPVVSAMVFSVYNLYAVKFRYTVEASRLSRTQARDDLVDFARALFAQVKIQSHGTCWSPPRVDVLASGAPEPTGAFATTAVDGTVNTWMFDDHIVVRQAGQADALLAQILTMIHFKRMYDGCDMPSDTHPTAPAGMRMIRLEYTDPSKPTSPSDPVRVPRAGVG